MKMASRLIDLISKKTNCTCSTLFLLLAKSKFARAARFFVFPLPLFCTTSTLFCTTKTSNFLVTHYFYREIVVSSYPYFVSSVHVCFYFSLPLIFTLLAASISHFLTTALNFHVFLPTNFQ